MTHSDNPEVVTRPCPDKARLVTREHAKFPDAWWWTLPTMWVCEHPAKDRVLMAEGWAVKCRACKTCRPTVSGVDAIDPGGDRWRHTNHFFPPASVVTRAEAMRRDDLP